MNITLIATVLFACLVGAALLGRGVRRYLPEAHLSADSKDAVKLAMGLVATMTALVLGLLINSAKSGYDTKRSEVIQMAAKVAFLDRVLALYGPEAAQAHDELRAAIADAVRRVWPSERRQSVELVPNEQLGDAFYVAIHRLSPRDDTQRALKAQAVTLMVDLGQLRLLLVAPPNATTTLALVASAFTVACAIFLILELDHPFGGPIRIPSAPMINVLNNLAK